MRWSIQYECVAISAWILEMQLWKLKKNNVLVIVYGNLVKYFPMISEYYQINNLQTICKDLNYLKMKQIVNLKIYLKILDKGDWLELCFTRNHSYLTFSAPEYR